MTKGIRMRAVRLWRAAVNGHDGANRDRDIGVDFAGEFDRRNQQLPCRRRVLIQRDLRHATRDSEDLAGRDDNVSVNGAAHLDRRDRKIHTAIDVRARHAGDRDQVGDRGDGVVIGICSHGDFGNRHFAARRIVNDGAARRRAARRAAIHLEDRDNHIRKACTADEDGGQCHLPRTITGDGRPKRDRCLAEQQNVAGQQVRPAVPVQVARIRHAADVEIDRQIGQHDAVGSPGLQRAVAVAEGDAAAGRVVGVRQRYVELAVAVEIGDGDALFVVQILRCIVRQDRGLESADPIAERYRDLRVIQRRRCAQRDDIRYAVTVHVGTAMEAGTTSVKDWIMISGPATSVGAEKVPSPLPSATWIVDTYVESVWSMVGVWAMNIRSG